MSFRDQDFGGPIPWMAEIEPEVKAYFTLHLDSLEAIVSKVPFGSGEISEAEAEMSEVITDEGDEIAERDTHRIPFWACKPLQDFLEGNWKKKTVKMWFWRTTTIKMVKGEQKENSKAHFEAY